MRNFSFKESLFLLLSLAFFNSEAQNIEWQKTVGGNPEGVCKPGIDQDKSVPSFPEGTSVVLSNSTPEKVILPRFE